MASITGIRVVRIAHCDTYPRAPAAEAARRRATFFRDESITTRARGASALSCRVALRPQRNVRSPTPNHGHYATRLPWCLSSSIFPNGACIWHCLSTMVGVYSFWGSWLFGHCPFTPCPNGQGFRYRGRTLLEEGKGGTPMTRLFAQTVQESASRCRTPRQFKLLLRQLRTCIPYRQLVSCWGNPSTYAICQIVDVDFPHRFLGWYISHGMHRNDPLLREGLRGGEPQLRSDLLRRMPDRFDPELLKKITEFQLHYEMAGGVVIQGRAVYFSLTMNTESEARTHIGSFAKLLPLLCRAFRHSYKFPSLTSRKRTILMWRACGRSPKQIADALGISPRTVKMHLGEIRTKLFAEDLVNAVWIAGQMGLIG